MGGWIRRTDKGREALELMRLHDEEGLSWSEAAERMGMSRQTAWRRVCWLKENYQLHTGIPAKWVGSPNRLQPNSGTGKQRKAHLPGIEYFPNKWGTGKFPLFQMTCKKCSRTWFTRGRGGNQSFCPNCHYCPVIPRSRPGMEAKEPTPRMSWQYEFEYDPAPPMTFEVDPMEILESEIAVAKRQAFLLGWRPGMPLGDCHDASVDSGDVQDDAGTGSCLVEIISGCQPEEARGSFASSSSP